MTQEQKCWELADYAGYEGTKHFTARVTVNRAWEHQIPIWQKALKEAKEMLQMYDDSELEEDYGNFIALQEACTTFPNRYHEATDTGIPEQGFEILYDLIQFIKKHKQ